MSNECSLQNTKKEAMEMTTPVVVLRGGSSGEKMEMTTPVLSQKVEGLAASECFLGPLKLVETASQTHRRGCFCLVYCVDSFSATFAE